MLSSFLSLLSQFCLLIAAPFYFLLSFERKEFFSLYGILYEEGSLFPKEASLYDKTVWLFSKLSSFCFTRELLSSLSFFLFVIYSWNFPRRDILLNLKNCIFMTVKIWCLLLRLLWQTQVIIEGKELQWEGRLQGNVFSLHMKQSQNSLLNGLSSLFRNTRVCQA